MFAQIKNWSLAIFGGLVGVAIVIVVVWAFVLPDARREGREDEKADRARDTLGQVQERTRDDAKREQMDSADLCVEYFRDRGRVPECDTLRLRPLHEE
ncbi:MAG: hypothetical protein ABGX47_23635 [Martelella sp.]|uniref:hypothetical protein n=1 Tax=Martelella sp. TaxID=1969699 RepID=UPI003241E006